MKTAFGIAIFWSVSLGVLVQASEAETADMLIDQAVPSASRLADETESSDSSEQCQPVPSAESNIQAVVLPLCGLYFGQPCSTPGVSVRCQWIQNEPGICVCLPSGIWGCG